MGKFASTKANRNDGADIDPARGLRITELMHRRGLRYNCQVCYDLGVSESTVSRWRSGRPFSLEHAIALSLKLDTSLDYLLTGRIARGEESTFSSELNEVLCLYQQLSPENERLSLNLLRSLSSRLGVEPAPSARAGGDLDLKLVPAALIEHDHHFADRAPPIPAGVLVEREAAHF